MHSSSGASSRLRAARRARATAATLKNSLYWPQALADLRVGHSLEVMQPQHRTRRWRQPVQRARQVDQLRQRHPGGGRFCLGQQIGHRAAVPVARAIAGASGNGASRSGAPRHRRAPHRGRPAGAQQAHHARPGTRPRRGASRTMRRISANTGPGHLLVEQALRLRSPPRPPAASSGIDRDIQESLIPG